MPQRDHVVDFGDLTRLVQRFRLWNAQWKIGIQKFRQLFKLDAMFDMSACGSIVSDGVSYRQIVIDGLEHTMPYIESLLDDVRDGRTSRDVYNRGNILHSNTDTTTPGLMPQVFQHLFNMISTGIEQEEQKPGKPAYKEEDLD